MGKFRRLRRKMGRAKKYSYDALYLVFPLLIIIAIIYALSTAHIGLEPSVDTLSTLLLASSFIFPILYTTLSDRKFERSEWLLVLLSFGIGAGLIGTTLSLSSGWDGFSEASITVTFLILGTVFILLGLMSLNVGRSRRK